MKKWILLLALFCCTSVFANPINKIIFFGDSLTDTGNLYKYDSHIMPKDPPYFQGRFSNNKVWTDYLGDYYRDTFKINYDNYAVGGATVVLRAPWKGCLPVSLSEEIDDYLMPYHSSPKNRADTLFVIMMGANDYDSEKIQDVNSLTDDVVNKLNVDIKKLINNGAQHFLILDVPDLSKTPRILKDPTQSSRLASVSRLHHDKLMHSLDVLKSQYPNLTFNFISIYEFFNDLITNLDKYNQKYNTHLTDATTSCWTGDYTLKYADEDKLNSVLQNLKPKQDIHAMTQYILNSPSLAEAYKVGRLQALGVLPCTNPDMHIFWDEIHPTTVVHRIFASFIEEKLATESVIR